MSNLIYHRVKDSFRKNKERRLEGKVNAIPWSLPKFSTVVPGVEKGKYIICTASSKVGKTQLADFLYMYDPVDFVMNNPNAGVKVKIFYFSLEMSKEEKIAAAIARKLYVEKGISIAKQDLKSMFTSYILEDKIERFIDEFEEYFTQFESMVTFVDHVRHPYGIFHYMKSYAEANGRYAKKRIVIDGVEREVNDYYIPNDPDEYVIVITDHLSLLLPENGTTLHKAMGDYSSNYCLQMRDKWGYIPVSIQQQAAEQEKMQFTYKGDAIEEKLRPSQDGLGDNKLTGRDCNLMIGLFAPFRYGITNHRGVNVGLMKDKHREISVILNRDGTGFQSVQAYFDGAANYFRELPELDTPDMNKLYTQIKMKQPITF